MQAVVVEEAGGPEKLQLKTVPVPEPRAGELLIRVAYSPLNPLDVQARAGRIRWSHPGYPFTPGCGFSGRVVGAGPGVAVDWAGRRVTASGVWGGNAEFAVAPVASVTPMPERFDWQLGSVAPGTSRTAWHLVHSAGRVRPGQSVVIHSAAGPVGALTAQVARSAGALVIGLAGGTSKTAFAGRFVDHALDYNGTDWPAAVRRLTAGSGADLIIDGNSGPNSSRNYDAVATLGQVIYTGAMAGPAPDVGIAMLIGRSISVTGFVVTFHEARDPVTGRAETEERLATGQWVIPVTATAGLGDVVDIHRKFENREIMGRVLVRIGGEL